MLKFGASQHFQEVSHEPPGTERGEKSVGDEGTGVRVVRMWLYMCVHVSHVCGVAGERRRCRDAVGERDGRLLEWHGGSMSWVKHGNMDAELFNPTLMLLFKDFSEIMVAVIIFK